MKALYQLLYIGVFLAACTMPACGSQQRQLRADVPQFLNEFLVPKVNLAKGVAYYGTEARLRRALHEVSEGGLFIGFALILRALRTASGSRRTQNLGDCHWWKHCCRGWVRLLWWCWSRVRKLGWDVVRTLLPWPVRMAEQGPGRDHECVHVYLCQQPRPARD
jgi:hypothetical protein